MRVLTGLLLAALVLSGCVFDRSGLPAEGDGGLPPQPMRPAWGDDGGATLAPHWQDSAPPGTQPPPESSGDVVELCHTPSSSPMTLWVDPTAVPAHLGHGDYLGRCKPAAK